MSTAETYYFRYARDLAFIDMVGHQGNDFQITDAFWQKLNELTAAFDHPQRRPRPIRMTLPDIRAKTRLRLQSEQR
jgi:hypothetical protein